MLSCWKSKPFLAKDGTPISRETVESGSYIILSVLLDIIEDEECTLNENVYFNTDVFQRK